jgi:hypothetical protein
LSLLRGGHIRQEVAECAQHALIDLPRHVNFKVKYIHVATQTLTVVAHSIQTPHAFILKGRPHHGSEFDLKPHLNREQEESSLSLDSSWIDLDSRIQYKEVLSISIQPVEGEEVFGHEHVRREASIDSQLQPIVIVK